jgi:hypothetical protein
VDWQGKPKRGILYVCSRTASRLGEPSEMILMRGLRS